MKRTLYKEKQIWIIETGIGKLYISYGQNDSYTNLICTTKIIKQKNIGKSNETSLKEQVELEFEALVNKKLKEGYTSNPNGVTDRLLPMLVSKLDEKRKLKLEFPILAQPKLDGVRCLIRSVKGKAILTSREGNEFLNFDFDLDIPSNYILDGELFTPELNFQDIISGVKRKSSFTNKLKFYCFDVIDLNNQNLKTLERLSLIDKLTHDIDWVVKVSQYIISNLDELEEIHIQFSKDYEGSIFRLYDNTYKFDKRSTTIFKYKTFMEEEFKIIGYKLDANKCVVWLCDVPNIGTFDCVPIGTHEYKRNLYTIANLFIGRNLTVKFQNYTVRGLPRFPIGKVIRDYE